MTPFRGRPWLRGRITNEYALSWQSGEVSCPILCSLNKALPLIKSHSAALSIAGGATALWVTTAGAGSQDRARTSNSAHCCRPTATCVSMRERKEKETSSGKGKEKEAEEVLCVRRLTGLGLLSWQKHIWKICVGDIVVNHRHIFNWQPKHRGPYKTLCSLFATRAL